MSRPLPLTPPFLPPTYGVLKSLLENPLKLPLAHDDAFGKEKDKEKKLDDDSTSTTVPQSAFLGPTLWDKTLPYDGDTFQLEYMDLEEFLSENGIPPSPNQHEHSPHQPGLQQATSASPSVMDLSSRASTSVHPGMVSQNCMQSPVRPADWQLWEPAAARFCPVSLSDEYFTSRVVPLISAQLVDCPPSAAPRWTSEMSPSILFSLIFLDFFKGGSWSQHTSGVPSEWKDILVISKEYFRSL
ncbi:hepatic leukemia factor isoform X3 [Cygnus olor]|uniref:hepatic leukemia factor isoform X3 n=1 Tax=Cygnus olor TaxID=8869 RepID=UPI001ADE78BA|nr:hepatic leukemia factor isoform X3 [Cygnus olor]